MIAELDGLEPRCCVDIKGIVVPERGPKSFETFEKQAPGNPRLNSSLAFTLKNDNAQSEPRYN